MRKVFILAAAAGLAGVVGSSGAIAMTSTSPAGVRVATEAMDSTALVHCRSYRHWHPWEHRWTHGCHGGASVVIRHGHRVGVGVSESVRSRTTISRGETSVRSRSSTSTGVSSSSKSSTSTGMKSGTSTTSKSGTSTTSKSGRAQGGEKSSTGGSTGAGGGSSSGQKQP